jgi:hypothetical protein
MALNVQEFPAALSISIPLAGQLRPQFAEQQRMAQFQHGIPSNWREREFSFAVSASSEPSRQHG